MRAPELYVDLAENTMQAVADFGYDEATHGGAVAEAQVWATLALASAECRADSARPPREPQWARLEIMGHRVVWGRVTEVELARRSFLQVEVFETDAEEPRLVLLYSPAAIFSLRPTAEERCREAETLVHHPHIADDDDDDDDEEEEPF